MTKISRILFVSHELTRSGAPLILFMAANYLRQHGYCLRVVSPVDGPLHEEYSQAGINIQISPHILRDSRVGAVWAEQADLVICNTILAWRMVFSANAVGIPCFWWIHETNFGIEFITKHPEAAEALSWATKVIFPSHYTTAQYLPYSPGENYTTLITGIHYPSIPSHHNAFYQKENKHFQVVNIATIEKRKGQDILVKAFARLPKQISRHFLLHLIGRTTVDKWFYRKIALHALFNKNIYIHGELPQSKVLEFLANTDIFVLSSRDEALPLSLLEAMALAKPIISTNAGGIKEVIVSGENGLLIEVEDTLGLMRAMMELYQNTPLREKLGKAARLRFIEHHTIEVMGKNLVRLINEIE